MHDEEETVTTLARIRCLHSLIVHEVLARPQQANCAGDKGRGSVCGGVSMVWRRASGAKQIQYHQQYCSPTACGRGLRCSWQQWQAAKGTRPLKPSDSVLTLTLGPEQSTHWIDVQAIHVSKYALGCPMQVHIVVFTSSQVCSSPLNTINAPIRRLLCVASTCAACTTAKTAWC